MKPHRKTFAGCWVNQERSSWTARRKKAWNWFVRRRRKPRSFQLQRELGNAQMAARQFDAAIATYQALS